jgi:hypothetical protein
MSTTSKINSSTVAAIKQSKKKSPKSDFDLQDSDHFFISKTELSPTNFCDLYQNLISYVYYDNKVQ